MTCYSCQKVVGGFKELFEHKKTDHGWEGEAKFPMGDKPNWKQGDDPFKPVAPKQQ